MFMNIDRNRNQVLKTSLNAREIIYLLQNNSRYNII